MSLFHPDTKWPRVINHSPHGVVIALALTKYPTLGIGLLVCFLVYELIEDFHERDEAYHDVLGCLISMFATAIVKLIF